MRKYPNTWDITTVKAQIDIALNEIEQSANNIIRRMSFIKGQAKNPLLIKMQEQGMLEASTSKGKWTFTIKYNSEDNCYYIDNAIKGSNMSNRTYRRGNQTFDAPLSLDDRQSQKRLKENLISVTESDIKNMVMECVCRFISEEIKKYKDSSIYGWNEIEKNYKEVGVSKHDLKLLHKSYNQYGEECAKRKEIPNGIGFHIWTGDKDVKSCEQGKGNRFPDYVD